MGDNNRKSELIGTIFMKRVNEEKPFILKKTHCASLRINRNCVEDRRWVKKTLNDLLTGLRIYRMY